MAIENATEKRNPLLSVVNAVQALAAERAISDDKKGDSAPQLRSEPSATKSLNELARDRPDIRLVEKLLFNGDFLEAETKAKEFGLTKAEILCAATRAAQKHITRAATVANSYELGGAIIDPLERAIESIGKALSSELIRTEGKEADSSSQKA